MVQADVYLTDILIGPLKTLPLSDWFLGVSYCGSGNWRQLAGIGRSRVRRLIVNLLFLFF